jgi:branched-subunit amino acid ABC-type transport system permease component
MLLSLAKPMMLVANRVDEAPEKFIEATEVHKAQLVCMSALLTTTRPNMETTIKTLKKANPKVLTMVVVGGAGSIAGSVIGAFVLMMVSEYLRALMQLRLVVYAAMMLAVLMFAPKGLYGIFKQMADWLRARLGRAMPKAA